LQSPADRRKPSEDLHSAPVSYDLNGALYGLLYVQVMEPSACIMRAPLMSEDSSRKFQSTAWRPGLPTPLNSRSNQLPDASPKDLGKIQIPVVYADLHADALLMTDFHSQKQNPDENSPIGDLRWNE